MGRRRWWIAVLLGALALSTGTAAATTGLLRGNVRAIPADLPVPGATVVVVGTGLSAVADENGDFRLPIVPVGLHRLRVGAPGFHERLIEGVAVWPDVTTTTSLALAPDTEPADRSTEAPPAVLHWSGPGTTRPVTGLNLRQLPAQDVIDVAAFSRRPRARPTSTARCLEASMERPCTGWRRAGPRSSPARDWCASGWPPASSRAPA